MNELVIMHDQQAVTTSLILAEAFEKEHSKVIRSIEQKINGAKNGLVKNMFAEATYLDKKGEQRKMYYLNRDGFTFIAMGFTGRKADEFKLKYIDAFNRMEERIKQQPTQYKLPQTYSEALIELAKEVKKNEALQSKADKYDRYLSNKGLITITEIAKEYGMSGAKLNQFLHEKGVIYKRGSKWFIYQKYANERYVGYEIHLPEGRRSLKWTPEGEMFIRELLENNNIKPVLEQPQQLTVQEPVKYSGKYYTASAIAFNLGLSEEWIMKIGEIANGLHVKPRFSNENIYCRKALNDNGFPRWEYTQYGAALIENEINKFRLVKQI
ncbi:phage regulatory protein/antirepressor Ant [Ligilactobacillus salivarius]|uniref:phage regulatory protein/antirepressor Ant n=1 Tax=Ligilactobacillus salivarius TaxID=1624 RepID=UPI00237DD477|nr:phage regulatory protein/antirepressor Ant [Ligilactobacillus salivarius]MDE1506697.1 phage regulatory protein/antirepressor Ant [Ligilactobacillus salivarius]MDE1521586.1 phage regulatory protein/antirepressor Ant [Ligilactobacillus salivarius]